MTANVEKIAEKASATHGTEPEAGAGRKPDKNQEHAPPLKGAKTVEVMNAEYALALSTGPQLKATSWRSIQLFGILLVAFMGSLSNGFDGSGELGHIFSFSCGHVDFLGVVMSAVNGMKFVFLV